MQLCSIQKIYSRINGKDYKHLSIKPSHYTSLPLATQNFVEVSDHFQRRWHLLKSHAIDN